LYFLSDLEHKCIICGLLPTIREVGKWEIYKLVEEKVAYF